MCDNTRLMTPPGVQLRINWTDLSLCFNQVCVNWITKCLFIIQRFFCKLRKVDHWETVFPFSYEDSNRLHICVNKIFVLSKTFWTKITQFSQKQKGSNQYFKLIWRNLLARRFQIIFLIHKDLLVWWFHILYRNTFGPNVPEI